MQKWIRLDFGISCNLIHFYKIAAQFETATIKMIKIVVMFLLLSVITGAIHQNPRLKKRTTAAPAKPQVIQPGVKKTVAAFLVGTAVLIGAAVGLGSWIDKKRPNTGNQTSEENQSGRDQSAGDQRGGQREGQREGQRGGDQSAGDGKRRCNSDYSDRNTGTTYYCDFSSGRYYIYDPETKQPKWYT